MGTTRMKEVFGRDKNILIGMIHLPPLLSIEGFPGIEPMIEGALKDLAALEAAGFDGALVENDNDRPHTEFANDAQIATLTRVAAEVTKQASIPVGVQMMLNDWKASFAIARAVDAAFTRLDVFVDDVTSEWGEIHPDPDQIMMYKKEIYPELFLCTDIQVKYKTMITPRPLEESARLALEKGSDALVITGTATGVETPTEKLIAIRTAFPEVPIIIGAGLTAENAAEQLTYANGALVGTSIKTGDRVDVEKARAVRAAASK
ncbi:MAG: photosystem I assembly BtpA-like protein [Parcubacteria bacterium C7867-001]|nr:MAG: photosystem I assembly BtpA-like protein [Parcubacteria bacterium C7867-001]